MTKKHLIALAKIIYLMRVKLELDKPMVDDSGYSLVSGVVNGFVDDLCDILKKTNSRFDRDRFKYACYGGNHNDA